MAARGRPTSGLKLAQVWLQRFAFILLLAVSVGLLGLTRVDAPWAQRVRAGLMDALVPIAHGLQLPAQIVADWFGSVKDTDRLQRENAELRVEIERLRLAMGATEQLVRENGEYRALLGLKLDEGGKHIAARVLADPGGPYVRSLLIRAGNRDGIRKGRAVVTAEGLIGRVTEVGELTARVMLITDVNSRTAVVVGEFGERAILAGNNAELPRLVHVPRLAKIAPGDKVSTSGHDGVLPPGLPVGEVADSDERGFRVKPFVGSQNYGFVRIIDHDVSGILPPIVAPGKSAERPTRRRDSSDGGSP